MDINIIKWIKTKIWKEMFVCCKWFSKNENIVCSKVLTYRNVMEIKMLVSVYLKLRRKWKSKSFNTEIPTCEVTEKYNGNCVMRGV